MNIIRQTDKKLLIINLLLVLVVMILLTDGIFPVQAGGSSDLQQYHYNFRIDQDTLNDETNGWLAADDNPSADLEKGTTYRVRFLLSQEGTKKKVVAETLEYGTEADCTSGVWTEVPVTPAAAEHFEMVTSGLYADDDPTTGRLLGTVDPELTWANGTGVEDPSNAAGSMSHEPDEFCAHEYAFTPTADAVAGATYFMRLNNIDTYTQCAELSIETPTSITVSGNLYSDETGTPYNCAGDTAVTIKVATDGNPAQSTDCTDGSGTFSIDISDVPNGAGSEVVVYVDSGETPNATTVTLAADAVSNIIDLHMYQNRVAVTYEAGSSITNTNLGTADNADAGIRYAVTGTDLLTDSGMELHVWTGKTYDPGGQVDTTSGDLHLDDTSTAYIDTAGSVIGGDIIVDGGATPTTLQFQAATTVAGGAITTPDGAGTDAVINTSGSPTVTITGTGDIGGGTSPSITFSGLIIGTATAATTTVVSSMTVTGVLDVDTGDSLSINASQVVTNTSALNAVIDGDIIGAGTLRFTDASGGPGTGVGTLSAIVRYDASAGNIASTTFDARTYNGRVEIYSNSATARTATFVTSGTYTLAGASSHLYVIADGDTPGDVTLVGTGNPTVTIGGDLDFTGSGTSAENITSGTGTWTVSGNVNFTDGTHTSGTGSILVMDGTGKTLTSASGNSTLQSLTLSGSITLADETHIINKDLVLSGTVAAGASTVRMRSMTGTITGGGNTLNNLQIGPGQFPGATSTLQTSNLTVSGTLTVSATDTLTIDTVSLTHTDTSDVAGTGNITGTGTLIFTNVSGGPGTGITTLSSIVRFDASAGNVATGTFDARIYGDKVEIFSDDSAAAGRSVAMANATYTLSGATSHLHVINNSNSWDLTLDGTLIPTVNIGGDLDFTGSGANSELIITGTGVWTVTGNINFTDGDVTFTTGIPDNTFQMDGTSKTITSDGKIFRNLSVTGGNVSNADELKVAGNFGISAGAEFTHGLDVDFIATGNLESAFVIADTGIFTSSGAGTGKLILDGVEGDQWFDDQSSGSKQNMGNVQIGTSPGTTKLRNNFAAANLTILDADKFETHGWDVDIADFIDCQDTCEFNLTDGPPNAAGNPTIVTFGGNWTMSAAGIFTPSTDSQVQPDGSVDQAVATGGKAFWDFYSNNSAGDADDDVIVSAAFDVDGDLTVNNGELDLNTNNPTTDVEGDVIINADGELLASSTASINVAGNWNNNGTFTAGAGTGSVTFDSGGAETIDTNNQAFNKVVFDNAAGSWTIQNDNMTTNSDLTLTAATAFNLNAALTLEVKGNFTLTVADAVTTWGAGSTLYLNGSGGMYNINAEAHLGDDFITLRIGATEDIAMWNSDATAFTIDGGGCLFSQDHGHPGADGRLNIYGTCTSRDTNEWWSYAKDFEDGAVVARQADVQFADGASLTVDNGETLEIIGQSAVANPSLITYQGAGTYGITISGTINAQYYEFDYLNASGLNIDINATVTELSDGSFDNAGAATATYITVTGIDSTKEFRNNIFDDDSDGVDGNSTVNVTADGADILWKFLLWDGNLGGEAYDSEANNAIVDWSEILSFSLSANVMNLGTISTLVVGSNNHTLTVTTNAVNGYGCSAAEDGNIRSGANDIDDVGDNVVSAGQEEYGISCVGNDCLLGGNDKAIPLDVVSNVGRVTANVATITYKAAAAATTVGTTFSHVVTYTCAGNF